MEAQLALGLSGVYRPEIVASVARLLPQQLAAFQQLVDFAGEQLFR